MKIENNDTKRKKFNKVIVVVRLQFCHATQRHECEKLWCGFFVQIHLLWRGIRTMSSYTIPFVVATVTVWDFRVSVPSVAWRGVAKLLTSLRAHGVYRRGFHAFTSAPSVAKRCVAWQMWSVQRWRSDTG